MESVSEAASGHMSTAEFLDEHSGQLLSFGLSFLLIATFWMGQSPPVPRCGVDHGTAAVDQRRLDGDDRLAAGSTAMIGQMDTDALQAVVYIGTLIMTQVTTLAGWLYLARHRELSTVSTQTIRLGAIGDLAAIVLFGAALVIAVAASPSGYYGLLLLLLSDPMSRVLNRLFRSRSHEDGAPPVDAGS